MPDAVVVGSGPNGLAAAIVLARAGLTVRVLEAADSVGGGARSAELTLPGFVHDVCSAIHPLGVASPFFRTLPLADHGLEWIEPPAALAHPFDDGTAALLERSPDAAALGLGEDDGRWRRVFEPLAGNTEPLLEDRLARSPSAAFGLMLGLLAHAVGWPFPRGGSQRLSDALASYLRSLGGEIETGRRVATLAELGETRLVLLDVTTRGLLELAGDRFPTRYRRRLERYRYGPGVFKLDWALDGPIPWRAEQCGRAATVHLGARLEEIAASEAAPARGEIAERPYVLLAQQSLFDPTRAPAGQHTAWAYCHVPNGSSVDMTERIEAQVERFAPGFRERILARSTLGPAATEHYNENYVGGDINGGAATLSQLFMRPVARVSPYTTPLPGVFLCSSSTPPGGGVHGMCGFHAALAALRQRSGDSHAS